MRNLSEQRILLVDDEPDHLMVFRLTLELLYNATVQVAGSAEAALAYVDIFEPTVIVSDLSMPNVDGFMLLNRFRQRSDMQTVPVIALTAHALSGDRDRVLRAGFNGYLTKPIDVKGIGESLQKFLTEFDARHDRSTISTIEPPNANRSINSTGTAQVAS